MIIKIDIEQYFLLLNGLTLSYITGALPRGIVPSGLGLQILLGYKSSLQ